MHNVEPIVGWTVQIISDGGQSFLRILFSGCKLLYCRPTEFNLLVARKVINVLLLKRKLFVAPVASALF